MSATFGDKRRVVKAPALVATTANITLSAPQTVDGVALVDGDHCLVKDQSAPAENGLYVVRTLAWTRRDDVNSVATLERQSSCRVQAGTLNGGKTFALTYTPPLVLETTSMTWSESGSVDSRVDSILAENTDGRVWVPASEFVGVTGTWTLTQPGDVLVLTRTAAAATEFAVAPIPMPFRTTALRGRKPTSMELIYSVNTANADDVQLELMQLTANGDNNAPTAGAFFTSFDSEHDNATKRGVATGAPEEHTQTVTITSPAYNASAEGLHLRVTVNGDAGAASVVAIKGAFVNFDETLVDAD